MSQRHTLFWLASSYIVVSRMWLDDVVSRAKLRLMENEDAEGGGGPDDATRLALLRTFSLLQRLAWACSISFLMCAEFSRLYCGGETIAAHYLRKFSRFLIHHEKYSLASRVLGLATRWNELWLGPLAAANRESFKQAAVANVLAGKRWWPLVKKLTNLEKK